MPDFSGPRSHCNFAAAVLDTGLLGTCHQSSDFALIELQCGLAFDFFDNESLWAGFGIAGLVIVMPNRRLPDLRFVATVDDFAGAPRRAVADDVGRGSQCISSKMKGVLVISRPTRRLCRQPA